MKVFVTGATGFIGSQVVNELILGGHEVVGLVRSDEGIRRLEKIGVSSHKGDLTDVKSLQKGIEKCDGIIHTGFIHDFSKFKESCEIDKKAILSMGEVLQGSKRPFIITSGIGLLSPGRISNENDWPPQDSHTPRVITEEAARTLGERGVHISLVRLPPTVHGKDDHGFVPMLINIAREKGVSAYLGEGKNMWSAVHRFDAARVFKLALEKGTKESTYHAVAETGIAFKEIAELIGRKLSLPVISKSSEEAAAHFSWFLHFAGIDCPSNSLDTQKALGWSPREIGLLTDIETNYF